jgi:hypothetical protein
MGVGRGEGLDVGKPFGDGLGIDEIADSDGKAVDIPDDQFGHTNPFECYRALAFDGPFAT